jgi:hypothetical protein
MSFGAERRQDKVVAKKQRGFLRIDLQARLTGKAHKARLYKLFQFLCLLLRVNTIVDARQGLNKVAGTARPVGPSR